MSEPLAENEAQQPRKRSCLGRVFRLFLFGVVLAVLLAVAAAFAAYMTYDYVTRPGVAGPPVRVEIPEGASGQRVGEILTERGFLEHPAFFRLAIRLDPSKAPIKHGIYELPTGLSPIEMLHHLQKGPDVAVSAYRITIPEGLTLKQTAELFPDPAAFLAAARDSRQITALGVAAESLEGFLMPNTYFFDTEPTAEQLVARMLEHFAREHEALVQEFPEAAALNLLELVTVASLVEEESRVDSERPLVAAVICNRLERGMSLDLDSTLQYTLNKYGQRLLDSDKEVDSPYNTYRNVGLPPGPISNPGVASLRAAAQPAEVNYLYFVSNADGETHTFSSTLAEHNSAVARFRREIAVQRREEKARKNDVQEQPEPSTAGTTP